MRKIAIVVLSVVCVLSEGTTASLGKAMCFGKDPLYDKQCGTFDTEAACSKQVVCIWADPSTQNCFSKDGNPVIDKLCKQFTNTTVCNGQVGCFWRSKANGEAWYQAIGTGVSALAAQPPSIPDSISLGSPSIVSVHDHKQVDVSDLSSTLQAWATKYNLAKQMVSELQALVAVESATFKSTHLVLSGGDGVLEEAAGGGRNFGGIISLAFVHARLSVPVTTYFPDVSCSPNCPSVGIPRFPCCTSGGQTIFPDHLVMCSKASDCTHLLEPRSLSAAETQAVTQQMQAWNYQKLTAESVLLKDEIIGPSVVSDVLTVSV